MMVAFLWLAASLWEGLTPGPHAVGVRRHVGTDSSRSYRRDAVGVEMQLVYWYPARAVSPSAPRLQQLDYEMLSEPGEPTQTKREAVADRRAGLAVSWRHVGIVAQTPEQAREALRASGVAVWEAPPAPGPFPVVVIGSPNYLSTTAEYLASHGYLVVSAIHFGDAWAERPPPAPGMSYEPSLRDQEWALGELSHEPLADLRRVAALGHGGGGMQALLLAERHATIRAVVSLDGANFSTRSEYPQVPHSGPLLLRVPMLNLLRQETLDSQDLFAEFRRMRYSRRYELVFPDKDLRHHDLSNIGRGVSAAIKIRGPAQAMVLERYATMHRVTLAFLDHALRGVPFPSPEIAPDTRDLVVIPEVPPAPSIAEVSESFSTRPAAQALQDLRRARDADPEGPLFAPDSLLEVAQRLTRAGRNDAALELLRLATEFHPASKEVRDAIDRARSESGRP